MEMKPVNIVWLRRDLRLTDQAALYYALKNDTPVIPLFIFDRNILDKLEEKDDPRVTFLWQSLQEIKQQLKELGSDLIVKYGKPSEIWPEILQEWEVKAVYTNRDYEQYAINRDESIKALLQSKEIPFHTFKDHVIFEKDEVLKADGTPYTVFTPYSRKWKAKLDSRIENGVRFFIKAYPCQQYHSNFAKVEDLTFPQLSEMGFTESKLNFPAKTVDSELIQNYQEQRNFPAKRGTSRLGIHLRFGTISIRAQARKSINISDTFLNELIWRDFYSQILANFPHVETDPFRAKYDNVRWRNNEQEFEAWCQGKTGYPLVDAGMRELNATGFMHNRVRMITASFLTKHLLIDWRWGEAYFAKKLLDFDLASNNGGWQWAAGSGTDAAPYFRIFNPESQQKKFDKEGLYIKKWVPELNSFDYPQPIVDHKFARERCLARYKEAF